MTGRGIHDLWYGEGVFPATARAVLWPVSRIYQVAMQGRARLYDVGLLRIQSAALPTVSVGNLTVGGTGKTPFAAWLVSRLSQNARPAIALRGYGGDEAEVHRRLNPAVPVLVNADRSVAVRAAGEQGADVAVLDDAFQHPIARTADILLLSAEQLMRPRRLLPAGPWREPLSAARRADLLVITRKAASALDARRAAAALSNEIRDVPIAIVHLKPNALVDVDGPAALPLTGLRGASVVCVAAVGEPRLLQEQLEQLGARVTLAAFRDHHMYSDAEIRDVAARVPPEGFAVCTLKDAVKLAGRWPGPSRLWYVSQQLVVEQGTEEIDRLLQRVLDARLATAIPAG